MDGYDSIYGRKSENFEGTRPKTHREQAMDGYDSIYGRKKNDLKGENKDIKRMRALRQEKKFKEAMKRGEDPYAPPSLEDEDESRRRKYRERTAAKKKEYFKDNTNKFQNARDSDTRRRQWKERAENKAPKVSDTNSVAVSSKITKPAIKDSTIPTTPMDDSPVPTTPMDEPEINKGESSLSFSQFESLDSGFQTEAPSESVASQVRNAGQDTTTAVRDASMLVHDI
jgi:hypothetical protein